MSIELFEAYAKAQSVSLHCTHNGRDALYDMQMLPVETSGGIRWSVYAQYGRRGARLTPIAKCANESFSAAKAEYSKMRLEKEGVKYYTAVPNARKSDIRDATSQAVKGVAATLPSWPGFVEFFSETHKYLEDHLGARGVKSIKSVVALTDLAYSAAEGVPDAIIQVKRATNPESVKKLLSPETLAWFPPGTAETAVAELSSLCAQL